MGTYDLFYRLTDGRYVNKADVEMAFYVTHGYQRYKHEAEFLKWLYSLLGKSIVSVVHEYDMQVEELAKSRPVLAIKLYRDRYGCGLKEAREYVEQLKEKA